MGIPIEQFLPIKRAFHYLCIFLTLGYGYWVPGKKEKILNIEKNMRFQLVKKLSRLRDAIKALKNFEYINGSEFIGYQQKNIIIYTES